MHERKQKCRAKHVDTSASLTISLKPGLETTTGVSRMAHAFASDCFYLLRIKTLEDVLTSAT